MNPKTRPEHLLLFVSTAEDPVIKVDIVNGLSGYQFSRLRLTCSLGSAVLWTNRTAVTQVVQLKDRVIRLAPGGNEGATAITRLSESWRNPRPAALQSRGFDHLYRFGGNRTVERIEHFAGR